MSALSKYIPDNVARSSDTCSYLSASPKDNGEGNNNYICRNQGFSNRIEADLLLRLVLTFSMSVLGPT